MLESADIVHHNFPDETADRLGIGKARSRTINPEIICSRVSTHSVGGFREGYRGHEPLGQAVSGITRRLGGDGPPTRATLLLNDMGTGHLAAFGLILALFHRMRTGEVQDVNAALSRTSTMFQIPFMLTFEGKVWDEPSGPEVTGWSSLNRLYRGIDGWFFLALLDRESSARLALVSGLEGADAVPDDQLEDWLVERFATEDVATWVERLVSAGAGAHRYTNIGELVTSDIARQRRLTALLDHPGLGKSWGIAMPRIGRESPGAELLVSRRPGMDTLDLLEEFGFKDAIADLLRSGVVAIGEAPLIETRRPLGYSLAKGFWDSRENSRSFLVGSAFESALARLDGDPPDEA
jgi:crotonobetainyl-CoA:carnitine CoA-transferase CaiB-like acyl-CoA transferase